MTMWKVDDEEKDTVPRLTSEVLRKYLDDLTSLDEFSCLQICRSVLKSGSRDFIDVILEHQPNKLPHAMPKNQLQGVFLACAFELGHQNWIDLALQDLSYPIAFPLSFIRHDIESCSLERVQLILPFCDDQTKMDFLGTTSFQRPPNFDILQTIYRSIDPEKAREYVKDLCFALLGVMGNPPGLLFLSQLIKSDEDHAFLEDGLKDVTPRTLGTRKI